MHRRHHSEAVERASTREGAEVEPTSTEAGEEPYSEEEGEDRSDQSWAVGSPFRAKSSDAYLR